MIDGDSCFFALFFFFGGLCGGRGESGTFFSFFFSLFLFFFFLFFFFSFSFFQPVCLSSIFPFCSSKLLVFIVFLVTVFVFYYYYYCMETRLGSPERSLRAFLLVRIGYLCIFRTINILIMAVVRGGWAHGGFTRFLFRDTRGVKARKSCNFASTVPQVCALANHERGCYLLDWCNNGKFDAGLRHA